MIFLINLNGQRSYIFFLFFPLVNVKNILYFKVLKKIENTRNDGGKPIWQKVAGLIILNNVILQVLPVANPSHVSPSQG